LATEDKEWVERITQLIENPELRKRMGGEGFAQVKDFDIKKIEKKLVGLITKSL